MAWELDADRPIYAQLVERIQPGGRKAAECQRTGSGCGGESEHDAEGICGTGAEWSDHDAEDQWQNGYGGYGTDLQYEGEAGSRSYKELYRQYAGAGV